jgi:hypothetical protein
MDKINQGLNIDKKDSEINPSQLSRLEHSLINIQQI